MQDDKKQDENSDKSPPPGEDKVDTYEKGRKGEDDILGTDTEGEKASREEGKKDKIDADQTRKEDEEKKTDDSGDDDD